MTRDLTLLNKLIERRLILLKNFATEAKYFDSNTQMVLKENLDLFYVMENTHSIMEDILMNQEEMLSSFEDVSKDKPNLLLFSKHIKDENKFKEHYISLLLNTINELKMHQEEFLFNTEGVFHVREEIPVNKVFTEMSMLKSYILSKMSLAKDFDFNSNIDKIADTKEISNAIENLLSLKKVIDENIEDLYLKTDNTMKNYYKKINKLDFHLVNNIYGVDVYNFYIWLKLQ